MIFISSINSNLINNTILPGFLTFLILLAIVPLVGIEVKGAKRWLNLYFFNFQPIELIKPFFILIIAKIISSNKFKNLNFSHLVSFLILSLIVFFYNSARSRPIRFTYSDLAITYFCFRNEHLFYIWSWLNCSIGFF